MVKQLFHLFIVLTIAVLSIIETHLVQQSHAGRHHARKVSCDSKMAELRNVYKRIVSESAMAFGSLHRSAFKARLGF